MNSIAKFWSSISIPQAIVLGCFIASLAAIVVFAPPHFWEVLAAADWRAVAGVVGSIVTAVAGVFVAPKGLK